MSAKMKWTPGPWRFGRRKKWRQCIDGHGWFGLAKVVVRLSSSDKDYDEGVANAHLIAAAPTLYEAALDAYNVFDGLANGNFKLNAASHKSAMKSLREAMAKARGEIP